MIDPISPLTRLKASFRQVAARLGGTDSTATPRAFQEHLTLRKLDPKVAQLYVSPHGLMSGAEPPGGSGQARGVRAGQELLAQSGGPVYDPAGMAAVKIAPASHRETDNDGPQSRAVPAKRAAAAYARQDHSEGNRNHHVGFAPAPDKDTGLAAISAHLQSIGSGSDQSSED